MKPHLIFQAMTGMWLDAWVIKVSENLVFTAEGAPYLTQIPRGELTRPIEPMQ